MRLSEYQVWHTFGAFFVESFSGRLEEIAAQLVVSHFAVSAVTSSGYAISRDAADSIQRESVKVESSPDKHQSRIELSAKPTGYGGEALVQSLLLLDCERRNVSPLLLELAPHVRAFLHPIQLESQGTEVLLYPQLKIYENGVFLIHFRLFSEGKHMRIEDFLDEALNLQYIKVTGIKTSPFLGAHAESFARSLGNGLLYRHMQKSAMQEVVDGIDDPAEFNGALGLPLVDFPPSGDLEFVGSDTFRFVYQFVPTLIAHLLARRGSSSLTFGDFSMCRSSVFLKEYDRQPETFAAVDADFDRLFAPILMRASEADESDTERRRVYRMRPFEGCLWFMREWLGLAVYSKQSVEFDRRERRLTGHNDIVFELVVLDEAMEYLKYSHHRLLQSALTAKRAPEDTLLDFNVLARMESAMHLPTTSGESRYAFSKYAELVGLRNLRERALEALDIQRAYLSERRAHRLTVLGLVVAGVVAVESLRNAFVVPLLVLNGAKFGSPLTSGETMSLSALTLALTIGLPLILWLVLRRLRYRAKR